jgi:hypothetical protein
VQIESPFNVTIYSSNNNLFLAKSSDTVVVRLVRKSGAAAPKVLSASIMSTRATCAPHKTLLNQLECRAKVGSQTKNGPVVFNITTATDPPTVSVGTTDGTVVVVDTIPPVLSNITLATSGANGTARAGDLISLNFTTSEPLKQLPDVLFGTLRGSCGNSSITKYSCDVTVPSNARTGPVRITVTALDAALNVRTAKATTDGSKVTIAPPPK